MSFYSIDLPLEWGRYMKKRVKYSKIKKDILVPLIFLLPMTLLYTGVLINSIFQAVYMSFFDWNGIASVELKFAGVQNYVSLFQSKAFFISFKVVGVFILQGLFLQMPLAFFLAIVVSQKMRLSRAYKTIFFIPVIIPLTAVGLLWTFIMNPNGGAIDGFMSLIGNDAFNVNFLSNPKIAVYSVATVSCWVYAGYNMVIFSSGMTAIPNELYEASMIDGANKRNQLIHITIPMLKETFKIYFVMMFTGSLKTFDLIFVMTKGGPNRTTESPAIMMYNEVFKYNHYGVGNSIATIILILGLGFSLITNHVFKEKE